LRKSYADGLFLDTGSPHFVTFVNDAVSTDVIRMGRALRNDVRFAPGGANIDFVELQDDELFVRTYERGVENETLSCGTGVTASALAHAFRNPVNPGFYPIKNIGWNAESEFFTKRGTFYGYLDRGAGGVCIFGEDSNLNVEIFCLNSSPDPSPQGVRRPSEHAIFTGVLEGGT